MNKLAEDQRQCRVALIAPRWTGTVARLMRTSLEFFAECVVLDPTKISFRYDRKTQSFEASIGDYCPSDISVAYILDSSPEALTVARYMEDGGTLVCGLEGPVVVPKRDMQSVEATLRVVLCQGILICAYRTGEDESATMNLEDLYVRRLQRFLERDLPAEFRRGLLGIDLALMEDSIVVAGLTTKPRLDIAVELLGRDVSRQIHATVCKGRKIYNDRINAKVGGSSVLFMGDTNPGESYQTRNKELGKPNILEERGYDSGFAPFASLLSSADLRVLNLEAVITSKRESPYKDTKPYVDWTHETETPALLKRLDIDLVSIANNHAFDFGEDALAEMQSILEETGIAYIGAGGSLEAASQPYLSESIAVMDRKVLIASGFEYRKNYDTWGYYAESDASGVNAWSRSNAESQVGLLREEHPEAFIVAFPHWGSNYAEVNDRQVNLGKSLIDAGADLVIGHGSHALQGVDTYSGKLIVYGIGNFIFNSPGRYRRFKVQPYGLIARLGVFEDVPGLGLYLDLYPIYIDNLKTNYCTQYVDMKQFQAALKVIFPLNETGERLLSSAVLARDQFGLKCRLRIQ
ncbi:MAG: CapA family protein [Pseudomonadota bacterium]